MQCGCFGGGGKSIILIIGASGSHVMGFAQGGSKMSIAGRQLGRMLPYHSFQFDMLSSTMGIDCATGCMLLGNVENGQL
jgi:hypothetical protein